MFDLSVVVPTHDRRHPLSQAIASMFNQTGIRLELIIVNDGSRATDERRIKVTHHASPLLAPRLTDRLSWARTVGAVHATSQRDAKAWLAPLPATAKRPLVEYL